jgi:hypothetical protein
MILHRPTALKASTRNSDRTLRHPHLFSGGTLRLYQKRYSAESRKYLAGVRDISIYN